MVSYDEGVRKAQYSEGGMQMGQAVIEIAGLCIDIEVCVASLRVFWVVHVGHYIEKSTCDIPSFRSLLTFVSECTSCAYLANQQQRVRNITPKRHQQDVRRAKSMGCPLIVGARALFSASHFAKRHAFQ